VPSQYKWPVVAKLTETYGEIVDAHRGWLIHFDSAHGRRWEQLLASNEGAGLCEACVRELLQQHEVEVSPSEDPATGGPDFGCSAGGHRFYVEATCLTMDVVTKRTGLNARFVENAGPRCYDDLTALVQRETVKKTPQCSNLDAPCLLAVGTFHYEGSGLCRDEMHVQHVLTSKTGISMAFDTERGEAVGDMISSTDGRLSSVVRPGATEVEAARRPISGILLCGFGCEFSGEGWPVRGALHPDAARPFPRELLPDIRFCELAPGYEQGVLTVKWT
jgi:hypothetical protein